MSNFPAATLGTKGYNKKLCGLAVCLLIAEPWLLSEPDRNLSVKLPPLSGYLTMFIR
jgi:hypothetical protein